VYAKYVIFHYRTLFLPHLPYADLTSLYDENKLRISYLQPKFKKSALTVSLILTKVCKQEKRVVGDYFKF